MIVIQNKKQIEQKKIKHGEHDTEKYAENIIRESEDKTNFGRINEPDIENSFTGPCGDTMNFFLIIEHDKIKKMNYSTNGCIPARACANVLCKMVKNKKFDDALAIKPEKIINYLEELPQDHEHCAQLAIKTLNLAIKKREG